jgi:hypothetical protein
MGAGWRGCGSVPFWSRPRRESARVTVYVNMRVYLLLYSKRLAARPLAVITFLIGMVALSPELDWRSCVSHKEVDGMLVKPLRLVLVLWTSLAPPPWLAEESI